MPRIWRYPIYKFTLPSREIVVNVSRSCPVFRVPTPGFPDVAALLRDRGCKRVLDFGAGKLRNALYLLSLKADFKVWAVEYEDCLITPAGQEALAEASRYPKRFFLKKWPYEFLRSDFEVDAVLLINVTNVVPSDRDRRRIVRECSKRLRAGGLFLWMTQYGEPHYKPGVTKRLQAPDGGWFYNLGKDFQTYYREYTIQEIKEHFATRQYKEDRTVSAPHHRAFLFEKR